MKEKGIIISQNQQIFAYIKKALLPGFGGYMLFLCILVLTKWIATFIRPLDLLTFGAYDFLFPVIGFVIPFLIKFLENFNQD